MAQGGEISGLLIGSLLILLVVFAFAFTYSSATGVNQPYQNNQSVNMSFVQDSNKIVNQSGQIMVRMKNIQEPNSAIPLYAEFQFISAAIDTFKLVFALIGLAFSIQFDILNSILIVLPVDSGPVALIMAAILFAAELITIGLFFLGVLKNPPSRGY